MNVLIKVTTVIYIACGLAAAYISFRIEFDILQDIVGKSDPLFAVIGALVFEVTKICTIILYRHSNLSLDKMPLLVKLITWLLRTGFIIFAVFCSLTFFSKFLASPNLEEAKEKEKNLIVEKYAELKAPYEKRIPELNKFIDEQRNIKYRDGTYQGPQFKQLNEEISDAQTKLNSLISEETNEIKSVNDRNYLDYSSNESIKNKTVNDLTLMVKDALNLEIKYSIIIFFLTFLTSFLIEFSIWVTFEHIIVSGFSNKRILEEKVVEMDAENRAWDRLSESLHEKYERLQRIDFLQSVLRRMKNNSKREEKNNE